MIHPALLVGCGAGGVAAGAAVAVVAGRHVAVDEAGDAPDPPLWGDWSGEEVMARADWPVVVALTGAVWVGLAARLGLSLMLPPFLLFGSGLVCLSVVDLRTYRLPDRLTLPLLAVGVTWLIAVSLARGEAGHLVGMMAGAAGLFFFLALLMMMSPQSLGFGDAKLGALVGLHLGVLSPLLVVYGLLFAGVIGLLMGLAILAVRRRNAPYPFGPALALGALVAVLVR